MPVWAYSPYRLGEKATIPPRLLLQRSVFFSSMYSFLYVGFQVVGYYLPLYFQAVKTRPHKRPASILCRSDRRHRYYDRGRWWCFGFARRILWPVYDWRMCHRQCWHGPDVHLWGEYSC